MKQLKGNGHRSAGQIIAEKLKGKNKPSERIPILEKFVQNGNSSRMDVFVQASSMLADERGKAKEVSRNKPMVEDINGEGLAVAMALSGSGGF